MAEIDHEDDGIVYYSDGSYMFKEAGTYYDAQGNPIEQDGAEEAAPESGGAEAGQSGQVPEATGGEPEEGQFRLDEQSEQAVEQQEVQQNENHMPVDGSIVINRYDNNGNYEGFYEIDSQSMSDLAGYLGVVADGEGVGVHMDSTQLQIVNSSSVLVPIVLFAVLGAVAIRTLLRSFE